MCLEWFHEAAWGGSSQADCYYATPFHGDVAPEYPGRLVRLRGVRSCGVKDEVVREEGVDNKSEAVHIFIKTGRFVKNDKNNKNKKTPGPGRVWRSNVSVIVICLGLNYRPAVRDQNTASETRSGVDCPTGCTVK